MDKYLVKKRLPFIRGITLALVSVVLSGCVTQNYENEKTPVVKNQANRDDMAATRVSLGLGYLKMGNMPQAKQNLEKAKNFAPEMVQVHTAFAHYYETVGEHKLTVEAYEKALSIKSDDADTLNNYGVYLCRQKQIQAAEKQFLKAIAVPSYVLVSKSYENLSSCFLQNDNFTKAEMYLNKAILHNPSSASTLFQMVRLQYAMADYSQAKQFEQRFEKVTRRFTPQSLALAYKVYLKVNERKTAKNYGAMLVKMYPQSWEAQQYLLNELEVIEADNLAKRYQVTQIDTQSLTPKKRIVKLSPKKSPIEKSDVQLAQSEYTPSEDTETSTTLADSPASDIATTTTTQSSNVSAAVDAVATTTSVESTQVNAELATEEAVLLSADKKIITQSPTADDLVSKPVVVLNAPVAEPIDEEVLTPTETVNSESMAVDSTENATASEEYIPLIDKEIFNVAKKPAAIIENDLEKDGEKALSAQEVTVVAKAEPLQEEQTEKIKPAAQEAQATENLPKFYLVKAGDTLYSISVKHNIKIKALRRWNKIAKNEKIHIKDIIFLENPNVASQ